MVNKSSEAASSLIRRYILYGIPFIIVIGGSTHFLFELSGDNVMIGMFAPVNESVWEHLKMTFWTTLIYWGLAYLILSGKTRPDAGKWFFSCAAAAVTCPIIITTFYYSYTGAFGVESLALDIFSMFLAVVTAQFFAAHIYRYIKYQKYLLVISVSIILLLAAAFIIFTFHPPRIPWFRDGPSGTYGI